MPQSHFFSGALPLRMAGVGGYYIVYLYYIIIYIYIYIYYIIYIIFILYIIYNYILPRVLPAQQSHGFVHTPRRFSFNSFGWPAGLRAGFFLGGPQASEVRNHGLRAGPVPQCQTHSPPLRKPGLLSELRGGEGDLPGGRALR